MDLQTIHLRTKLPPRRLRYVVDHAMISGLQIGLAENEGGQPRIFGDFDGFRIACASTLLEAGMKREPAAQFVEALTRLSWNNRGNFLEQVFSSGKRAFARLGDGRAMEVEFGSRPAHRWCSVDTLVQCAAEFKPLAVVEIDLGRLRETVLGKI